VRALRAFASWLEREGYTDTNRLQHMRPPKASPPLIQPLSADEIRRVVAACASARDRALLLTLLDTGLRAGEALGLRFQDAHVEGNAATLLVLGKGDRQRLVPVGPVAQQALARYKYGPRPAPARPSVETLFLTNQGEPLTANALKMIFERLRRRSGIARLHPHICRHTFSTHYLHNGGDLFSLQMILGHRSLEMVRRYSHLADSHVLRRHREFSPLAHLSLRTPKTKEKLNGGPAAALDPDAVGYERRWR
jgi:integrase/recombinase XerC/integrase/recombinase XerD